MLPKIKIPFKPTNYRRRIWLFMADKGNCVLLIVAFTVYLLCSFPGGIITSDHKHDF